LSSISRPERGDERDEGRRNARGRNKHATDERPSKGKFSKRGGRNSGLLSEVREKQIGKSPIPFKCRADIRGGRGQEKRNGNRGGGGPPADPSRVEGGKTAESEEGY